MTTLRQQMIDLLETDWHTVRDLSKTLKLSEKDIYAHMSHIQRSAKAQKKKLVVSPYQCLSCAYVFKDRKRLTRPGRCPKCKGGPIEPAWFRIKKG